MRGPGAVAGPRCRPLRPAHHTASFAPVIEQQVLDDRFGYKIVLRKLKRYGGLFETDNPSVDFPIQRFVAGPDSEIQDYRTLVSRHLSFPQGQGYAGSADVFSVTAATEKSGVCNLDLDLDTVAVRFSSFHCRACCWLVRSVGFTLAEKPHANGGRFPGPSPCIVLTRPGHFSWS